MESTVTNLILLRDGLPVGAFFLAPGEEMTIGRATDNRIILNDDRCSRLHAAVTWQGDGWYLRDLASRNGTVLNGKRVTEEVKLADGDQIQIGHATLQFRVAKVDSSADNNPEMISESLAAALGGAAKQTELTSHLIRVNDENKMLRSLLELDTEIVGVSPAMENVLRMIQRVAPSRATVLIRGESGVGKELIARTVHANSPRRDKPMICLNCAALSETLLESELFGHEKGAFTGATERKIGKFEAADGSTLFVDEIAEMSPSLQAKILRVLEGQPFERVGGNKPIQVDVRVIAATNRDLEKEVARGWFRHDLFFRLHVLEILVPPLRKRPEDVPLLADHFLGKFCVETKRKFHGFSSAALVMLDKYRWPGNVRELKNVVERAVLLGNPPLIEPEDLLLSTIRTTGSTGQSSLVSAVDNPAAFVPRTIDDMERILIRQTLEHFDWNKSRSSRALGIERTTLDRKIARYGLSRFGGSSGETDH